MTDKKLTDEEIISSLEVIATTCNCNECKIRSGRWGTCNCSETTANAALDLINHQKLEIESLNKVYQANQQLINSLNKSYFLAKTEAVKEFAERLKNKIQTECNPYGAPTFDYDTSIKILNFIDNLVKGMVGENNA